MRHWLMMVAALLIAASLIGSATAQMNPFYQPNPEWQPWQQAPQQWGPIPIRPGQQQQSAMARGSSIGARYLSLKGTVDPVGITFAPSAIQWGVSVDGGKAWSVEYQYLSPQHGNQAFHLEKETQLLGYKWDKDVNLDAGANYHHLSASGPRIIVGNSNVGLRPVILGEWWSAKMELQRVGNGTTTATKDRPLNANWTSRQALIGGGVAFDYPITSVLSAKAIGAYLGGGSTGGALFDAGISVTWKPVSVEAGYLYRQARWHADGLDMTFGANTPYIGLRLGFSL